MLSGSLCDRSDWDLCVKSLRLRIVAALLVLAAVCSAMALLPVRDYVRELLGWMEGLGFWGPMLLVAAYVLACLFCIPGFLLSVGAGFLFGVVVGTITVSIGSVLGASAAFLVGRMLGLDTLKQMIAGYPKFAAIDRAVGREGFKIVLLARLSPVIPFNFLNYALALSPVRLRDVVLASWIGMFPATLTYVYIGSTLADLAELGDKTSEYATTRHVFLALGLAATILLTVSVTRMARKALGEADGESAGQRTAPNRPASPADQDCTDAIGKTSPD
ncbi:MAG: TVP38/TMEM64 family protein [Planctomycetia bacterium]|nr:TVP38/TMEM64 family protein [Planctomycetia bacterium]